MQRNNGAGGSIWNIIKPSYIEFYNSFYNSLAKPLPLQADDFTDLKCVNSIYIAWILNPTFFSEQTKKPQA